MRVLPLVSKAFFFPVEIRRLSWGALAAQQIMAKFDAEISIE